MLLDVIGEVTFSQRFGLMEIGEESESLRVIKRAARSGGWVGQIPWVYRLHQRLSPLIGNHLAVNARSGAIRDFTLQQAQSRIQRGSDHRDMLSKLIEMQEQKPTEVDNTIVISMATSNVFAGSDTTAVALRTMFYYLLKNPKCLRKLLDEIDSVVGEMDIDKPVTYEQANNMPYLQAVMNEALRIHPIGGQSLPRIVPEGGLQVEGHLLPAGVRNNSMAQVQNTPLIHDRQLSAAALMSLGVLNIYTGKMPKCSVPKDGWKAIRVIYVSRPVAVMYYLCMGFNNCSTWVFGIWRNLADVLGEE